MGFSSSSLASITIPTGTTTIEDYAFYNNNLADLIIPSSVVTIGSEAFTGNPFTTITVEGVDSLRFNSNWTSIGFPAKLMTI